MPESIVVFKSGLAEAACFALESYTQHEIENLSGNSNIEIAKNKEHVRGFIEEAKANNKRQKKILLGKINGDLAQKIQDDTSVNLNGYHLELRADEIRHLFKQHGNEKTEVLRGQRAVIIDDVISFADIVQNYDQIKKNADSSLTFVKTADGIINAVTLYATRNKSLSLKTMWVNRKGSQTHSPTHNTQNDSVMSRADNAQKDLASY
ncbi:MAG: hypothetical protein FWC15_02690 [Fibromonadales bacterium]|nr:hypothetical protein [Fibromonadales bacterium]